MLNNTNFFNIMPDGRKAKSVGFLFFYLYTVLANRFNVC